MFTNHWGKWVDSDQPIGGVVSIHSLEWIDDETSGAGAIDLSFEEYRSQWFDDKLADYQNRLGYDRNPSPRTMARWEAEFTSEVEFWEAQESRFLIGQWIKDDNGLYMPDPNGEYSAIVSYDAFMCVQVARSKYARRSALCSPCFPGQADLDTAGEYLAYDLPSDLYGEPSPHRGDRNPNPQIELQPQPEPEIAL